MFAYVSLSFSPMNGLKPDNLEKQWSIAFRCPSRDQLHLQNITNDADRPEQRRSSFLCRWSSSVRTTYRCQSRLDRSWSLREQRIPVCRIKLSIVWSDQIFSPSRNRWFWFDGHRDWDRECFLARWAWERESEWLLSSGGPNWPSCRDEWYYTNA